jgi:3-dehydroquinate synthase
MTLHITNEVNATLNSIIEGGNYNKVVTLVDSNTRQLVLPLLPGLSTSHVIEIAPGDANKNIDTLPDVWRKMGQYGATRHSVLVNLGGGSVTDLGGFAASTYKRGINFINVPTTLLAMVDAAIGGKTGIDFVGAKNQIGTFAEAEDVLVDPVFLSTLPRREILSGMAEMLKYGFVADANLSEINLENYQDYILRAGEIKREIVAKDPKEAGLRKILNFGHTLGHAIESHCLTTDYPLLHGEAVALGMAGALWLSVKHCGLDEQVLKDYEKKLPLLLSEADLALSDADVEPIMDYLAYDKKNKGEKPQFVLLEAVGKPVWDAEIDVDTIEQSLEYVIGNVRCNY